MSILVLEHLQNTNSSSPDLTIDSNGRIGVGTETPSELLHVSGTGVGPLKLHSTNASGAYIRLSNVDTDADPDHVWIGAQGNDTKFYQSNSLLSMIIKSDGKVGIGTSSPASKLHVKKDDSTAFSASSSTWHNILVSNENTTGGTRTAGIAFELNGYHANAGTGIAAVKNGTADDYGADLAFITRPQSAVAEERLRITDTGNVGIGRTTPQSKLEVWTGNGELSHFGSNNANADTNYTGITLGYAEAGANSNYRKVGIVSVGRGDGAARQDLAFLVDSQSDGNSVDIGDTKMRISHEGYVTTPNQPAFGVRGTNFNGTTFLGGTVFSNIGNHFNTTTGLFTAPVAGTYNFNFTLSTSDTQSHFVDLYKNGVSDFGHSLIYGVVYNTGSMTINVTLAAGDTMSAHRRGAGYAVYNALFSGHLIG